MKKDTIKASGKYVISLLILISFTLWFSYDIYTLKKYFSHPDFRLYYPFRQWFSQRLLNGEFPLWNPYWGIGQPAVVWATIPIDIYTILEIIFGPQYQYFQTIQLTLILLAGFYTFVKLGFHPMVSVTGILLFFMTPWVTYFYFYFINAHSFIANILLFLFVYKWFKTENKKYLFYITWITIFSMFGTKPEFWFFQTTFFVFFSVAASLVFYSGKLLHSIKMISLVMLAMSMGVISHLWQLNILIRVIGTTDRIGEYSIYNLFYSEMYYNLLISMAESELLKMIGVGFLFYLGVVLKRRFSWVFLFLGIVMMVLFANNWHISFIKSPVFYGATLGIIFSLIRGFTWKDCVKCGFIFLLLIYYWCRTERGDLGEMEIMRSAPSIFKVLVAALVWTGCMQFWRNKLAKLAYFSILFILLMRDQGQIILAYLTGLFWIPTRDNYIIDFAVTVLGVLGLASLNLHLPKILLNKPKWCKWWSLVSPISIVSISVIVLSASSNFYYVHSMMKNTPSDYLSYAGVSKVREVIKELHDSSMTRIFFSYDDWWGFGYGMGSSLLEGVGEVNLYDSLVPKNYKDWTVYKRLGIRPEQRWSGYPNEYTEKTISKLPKKNALGYSNLEIYLYNLLLAPPMDKNDLKLLGVKHIVGLFPISNQMVKDGDIEDIKERKEVTYPGISGFLSTGRISNYLPRAYLVYGIPSDGVDEFMNELNPTVNGHSISTKSFNLSFGPAHIEKYEPERVFITVEAKEDAYLVVSDIYHPFWHARLDGHEIDIMPAFYIFRGIKIPQGKHFIDFYCKIPHLKINIIISLLAILLCVLSTVFYFWLLKNK